MDFVFPETLHIQLSVMSSHLKFLKSYIDSVDTVENTMSERFKDVIESIGLSDRVLRKLYKNKRPPLIGYSCLKFRESLVNVDSNRSHWQQFETIAVLLVNGRSLDDIIPYINEAPLSKFILENFENDYIFQACMDFVDYMP